MVEREKEHLGLKGFIYLNIMRVSEGERERDSREERTRGYSWTWNIMKCIFQQLLCYSHKIIITNNFTFMLPPYGPTKEKG